MSDPLRHDEQRPLDPASEAERDAKIEQLLLAGLEHYFVAEYEQAINVWTRALFLDRAHARARAYIERARSAQAERQRECEELLQRGVHAFNQGEAVEARRLLRDAMDQGAPPEEALVILDRLNRLEQVTPGAVAPGPRRVASVPVVLPPSGASWSAWAAVAVLALVIVGSVAFGTGVLRITTRPAAERAGSGVSTPRLPQDEVLKPPRRAELALARAQALMQRGRLRDALSVLETIRVTDRERADAERLRGDIQRQLIALELASSQGPPPAAGVER